MKIIQKTCIFLLSIASSQSSTTFKKVNVDQSNWIASALAVQPGKRLEIKVNWNYKTSYNMSFRTLGHCSLACMKDSTCQAFNFDQNVCTTSSSTTFFAYKKQKPVLSVWVNPLTTTVSIKISK